MAVPQALLGLLEGGGGADASPLASVRLLLAELIAHVDAVEDGTGTCRQLVRRVGDDSRLALAELSGVPGRRRRRAAQEASTRIHATMDALGGAAPGSSAASLAPHRAELVAALHAVETLEAELAARRHRWRALRKAVLIGVPVAASLVTMYLMLSWGLEPAAATVLHPAGAYSADPAEPRTLRLEPEWVADTVAAFSLHYFGRHDAGGSRFARQWYDPLPERDPATPPPPRTRHVKAKLDFEHVSYGATMFVSDVQVVAVAEANHAFPWDRLDVRAEVVAAPEAELGPDTRLLDGGVGPALAVAWRLETAAGFAFPAGFRRLVHGDTIRPWREWPREALTTWRVRRGELAEPLWWVHGDEKPSRSPDLGPLFEVPFAPVRVIGSPDPGWYEEIRTPARLRALTPIAHDEPATLTWEWEALDGTPGQGRLEGRAPDDRLWFAPRHELLTRDPRKGPAPDGHQAEHDWDPRIGTHMTDVVLQALGLVPTESGPEGVDVLAVAVDIDLEDLPLGGRAAGFAAPNAFLNAHGRLVVEVILREPGAFHHRLDVRVNGESVGTTTLPTLAPEHLTFEAEGPDAAVTRLRELFGAGPVPEQPRNVK